MHVVLGADSSSGKQAGGGRTHARTRRPRARPSGKGEDDREEPLVGWAGQLQCWAGWWAPGKFSLLCFISVLFCFYLYILPLIQNSKQIQNRAKPSEYFYVAIMDFSRGT